jgi:DNA-binding Lrp family transcriptional regulator
MGKFYQNPLGIIELQSKGVEILKKAEVDIIAELMKNSRRSDRQLAKAIHVSQPTVSRLIKKLENKGLIKQYTTIPDFPSLGFTVMAVSFFKFGGSPSDEKLKESREKARRFQAATNPAVLMVMSGTGMGFDRIVITLHRDYSSYVEYMRGSKELVETAYPGMGAFDSFIVDLCDKTHFQPLSLAALSGHVKKTWEIERSRLQK